MRPVSAAQRRSGIEKENIQQEKQPNTASDKKNKKKSESKGRTDPEPTYSAETVAFVQQQYDLIRSDRAQITPWFAT